MWREGKLECQESYLIRQSLSCKVKTVLSLSLLLARVGVAYVGAGHPTFLGKLSLHYKWLIMDIFIDRTRMAPSLTDVH